MRERKWIVLSCILAGCASPRVDTRADRDRVRELLSASAGSVELERTRDDAEREAELERALAGGLELEEALRLALARNERLHAGFAALGVARAEYVESGLFRNPSLGFGFLFPSGGERPKFALDVVQSIVDAWELPKRRAFADAAMEERILELARFASLLLHDTKAAYYESIGARELASVASEQSLVATRAAELVEAKVASGVATRLQADAALGAASHAELESLRARRELGSAARRLATLLSVERDLAGVELVSRRPHSVAAILDRESVVERAFAARLDLRASEAAVRRARAELELEEARSPAVEVSAGIERPERGADASLLAGAGASVELPLSDRKEARTSRARFALEEREHELAALRVDIAQAVRAACDRLTAAWRADLRVREVLSPRAEESAARMRLAHETGNATVLDRVASELATIEVRRASAEARLDALRAAVELERVAGAPLEKLLVPRPRQ